MKDANEIAHAAADPVALTCLILLHATETVIMGMKEEYDLATLMHDSHEGNIFYF